MHALPFLVAFASAMVLAPALLRALGDGGHTRPNYRDRQLPFPFGVLTLFNRPKSGVRPIAETAFAALFAAVALFAMFNEGFDNWQSLWTCAMYFLLAVTLWRARGVQIPK